LLHVGVFCKVLGSVVFLEGSKEMEITEHEGETVVRVVHNLPAALYPRRLQISLPLACPLQILNFFLILQGSVVYSLLCHPGIALYP